MKTVLNKETREELISRIEMLHENSKPEWGKMNVYQMLKHCTLCEEMYLGKKNYKRKFIGRLFGRMGLRKMMKDETPLQRNAPTSNDFKILETDGDVSAEKRKWISLIEEYANLSDDGLEHWFFGRMTKEQVGYFVFKHTDHHLRQFNC
jgi:hypothetical protein